ncbi:DDE_3 domain-containing protein [Trichonephila clavipes]|nr:DDE_3 domain-containing protein [Trichonephila clavipes]
MGRLSAKQHARPHTARISQQCLQSYEVLPWPARIPNHLSLLHHVYIVLERLQRSRNAGELTAQLQRLWHDLPYNVTIHLIKLIPRRVSVCIATRDGFTAYLFVTFPCHIFLIKQYVLLNL